MSKHWNIQKAIEMLQNIDLDDWGGSDNDNSDDSDPDFYE